MFGTYQLASWSAQTTVNSIRWETNNLQDSSLDSQESFRIYLDFSQYV